ncbi:hypothetical protein [Pelagibacterium sp.]|uniref:hypothetical protein n=1 Tax=Pelagibacterium sp. TaxID=1967288 RepID=UPI003BAD13F2
MARNRVFDSISGFFGDVGRARNASNLYADLSNMSDDALRSRGLNRSDLARHAFDTAFSGK